MTKVLIFAADKQLTEHLHAALPETDYTVEVCAQAAQAVDTTTSFSPDVILAHDDLPMVSGRKLAQLFQKYERLRDIPFLLLVQNSDEANDLALTGIRLEASALLPLSVSPTDLRNAIHTWLDRVSKTSSLRTDHPWFRGAIDALSLTRLFLYLIRHNETGELRLRGDRRQLKVLIRDRHVVDVELNYLRDSTFGRYLVQQEIITVEENERALQLTKRRKIGHGEALLELGVLSAEQLDTLYTQQKLDRVSQLFSPIWNGGAFHFIGEQLAADSFDLTPMPLHEILRKGLFEEVEAAHVERLLRQYVNEDRPLVVRENLDDVWQELGLASDRRRRLDLLTHHGLPTLRRETNDEEYDDLVRLAFLLLVAGGVTSADQPLPTVPGIAQFQQAKQYRQWLVEGRTHLQRENPAEALEAFKRAGDLHPRSSEVLALQAWCRYELAGRSNITTAYEAKELLKEAISLDDTNDEAYLFLGRILKAEGKDGLAAVYLTRAFEINPTNDEARKEVKILQIVAKRREREQAALR